MSPKAAFISLLLAAASIVLLFVISNPSAPNRDHENIESGLDFNLPRFSKLQVDVDGFECVMSPWISRDIWIADLDGVRWPVASARVRAAAERVESAIHRGVRTQFTEELASALTLNFACDDGARALEISPGVQSRDRIRVRVGDSEAVDLVSESSVAEMFAPESLRMWREATVLISVRGKDREFVASSGAMRAELSRGPSGWTLQRPVLASANDAAVNLQLGKLRSMRARRILPETAVPAAVFESPIAQFEAVTELPDGAGQLRESVVFGNAADLSNQTLYVRVHSTVASSASGENPKAAWGPAVLVVDRTDVEQLTADPRVYVSNRATAVVTADVLAVVVRDRGGQERRFERTAAGWNRDAPRVEALVRMLCESDANFTHLEGVDSGGDAVCEIEFHGSRGPIDRFVAHVMKSSSTSQIVIESGGLQREFQVDDAVRAWIGAD